MFTIEKHGQLFWRPLDDANCFEIQNFKQMQPLPSVFLSNAHFFTHIHACAGRRAVWIDWQVSMAPVHYCLDAGGLPHPVSFPFTERRVPQRSRFLLSAFLKKFFLLIYGGC